MSPLSAAAPVSSVPSASPDFSAGSSSFRTLSHSLGSFLTFRQAMVSLYPSGSFSIRYRSSSGGTLSPRMMRRAISWHRCITFSPSSAASSSCLPLSASAWASRIRWASWASFSWKASFWARRKSAACWDRLSRSVLGAGWDSAAAWAGGA